jgi:hypothetical protein
MDTCLVSGLAVLRWRITDRVVTWWRRNSGDGSERVEGQSKPVLGAFVGCDFVVAAAQVLEESVSGGHRLSRPERFRPRIGRSQALSRLWSASMFA